MMHSSHGTPAQPPQHQILLVDDEEAVLRTLRRFLTREELWNGNREPLSNFWRWDPERNVLRWAWTSHPRNRERYEQSSADGSWGHARVVRLRTPEDVARFECACAAQS